VAGSAVRKKRILGWAVVIGGAVAATVWAPLPQDDALLAPRADSAAAPDEAPKDKAFLAQLPARETIGRRRGELFPSQSWAPPRKPAAAAVEAAPPAPVPPPMPYRVEAIGPKGVTLVYLPLNVPQQLAGNFALETAKPAAAQPLPPVAADNRPARLRLEGPARIRAGDRFSVALKVTSDQAVRSAPVQLSFDAALLEPVDVRRGGFFADGIFSFRINPSGSIFIGAAGKGAIPADAEFFVVTFKPVRAGAAELKLSSVLLQGAAGRAIAHDQPAAFRTSIVQ
jgi:hypothetical protein